MPEFCFQGADSFFGRLGPGIFPVGAVPFRVGSGSFPVGVDACLVQTGLQVVEGIDVPSSLRVVPLSCPASRRRTMLRTRL